MKLGMQVGLGPWHIVLDGIQLPSQRGTAPNFRPISIVAKLSPISATVEHLLSMDLCLIQMNEWVNEYSWMNADNSLTEYS